MKKRFLSMLLALAMVLALFPAALAADVTEEQTAGEIAYESETYDASYSGTCGDNVSWSIANGKLTISGTGRMYDYGGGTAPWNPYEDQFTAAEVKEGVTNIGRCTFHTCYHLASVSIASSVTGIGEYSFVNCKVLKEVVLPDAVTEIGANAFNGCTALETITLPVSLTSIGTNAFSGCSALTAAKYKGNETQWNAVQVAFGNDSLTDVLQYALPVAASGSCGDGVTWTLEGSKLTISGYGSMSDYHGNDAPWEQWKSGITYAVVEWGVGHVGDYAFYGCDLERVFMSGYVDSIGKEAFGGCKRLASVTIPSWVRRIGDSAFDGCTALKEVIFEGAGYEWEDVVIGSGNTAVTEIVQCTGAADDLGKGTCGESAYWAVTYEGKLVIYGTGSMYDYIQPVNTPWYSLKESIQSVQVKNGITYIGVAAFEGLNLEYGVLLGSGLKTIGQNAFYSCSGIGRLNLPDNVTCIGDSAFTSCKDIDGVAFSEGLTEIGIYAFYECTALTSVRLPDSVTSVGGDAFANCPALTELKIGKSVQSIGVGAFYGCTALKRVMIPKTVTSIGSSAFAGCPGLTIYGYSGSEAERYALSEYLAFAEPKLETPQELSVSGRSLRWKAVEGADSYEWNLSIHNEVGVIAMKGTVTTSYANLQDFVNDPDVLYWATVIAKDSEGNYMDSDESEIFRFRIEPAGECGPMSTWALDDNGILTFTGSQIMEKEEGETFGWYPFRKSIKGVVIKNAWDIPGHAFDGYTGLTYVVIPANMMSVGVSAFAGCTALKDVYYGGTAEQWADFRIGEGNACLRNATVHYESEGPVIPGVPANLTASNKSAGVSLTWDAVSDADSYTVYRDGVQLGTSAAASYTDKTAKSGSEYAYTVQAAAGDVHSADSDAAKIMYLSVPANVKCTNGSEGITVTWDKVDGATGYTLYRRLSTTTTWTAVFTSTKATTLSKLDTGVTDGKTYYYTVRANYKSTDGNAKYYSSKATTGTKVVCKLTVNLEAPVIKSIVNGFSSILVKWSKVTGAEGYYVYRKAENGSSWTKLKTVKQPASGSTVSFGNTTPKNGETYTYKVVAYKGTAVSPDSNEKTYMRLTYPTLKAVSTTAGKISFSWTDNAIATSFQIEYTTADTFTGATRKTLTSYKTSTSYSGFESGAEYHVRVRAYVKYFNKAEGKDMFYYGTWSSADETGASTQTVKVK